MKGEFTLNKRNLVGLAALIIASAGGFGIGLAVDKDIISDRIPEITNRTAQEIVSDSPVSKPKYMLKGEDGKLAVFIIGKKEPELVFDIYLHHLPDIDRKRLEEGIEVFEYEQLLNLIEDFTS